MHKNILCIEYMRRLHNVRRPKMKHFFGKNGIAQPEIIIFQKFTCISWKYKY